MSDHKRNATAQQFTRPGGQAPPAQLRDALGRVIEIGDEVLAVMPSCMLRVASVKPVLHPGAPPNLMELVMVMKLSVMVPRDTAMPNVYFLRHQAEIGDQAIPPESPERPEQANGEPE